MSGKWIVFYANHKHQLASYQCKQIRHGRLTECFESAGGNAVAATFIIVDAQERGKGYGRLLMGMLEKESMRLGYHYVYLWTKTAIPFYKALGYQKCQRLSLKRDCLKSLNVVQIENLEGLLRRRANTTISTTAFLSERQATANEGSLKPVKSETILLPPSDDTNEAFADVWLRKRLVEQVASLNVPLHDRLVEIQNYVASTRHFANVAATTSSDSCLSTTECSRIFWRYHFISLTWQAQIGPSCGLTALRMVLEYFYANADARTDVPKDSVRPREDNCDKKEMPSLLSHAQERGYTCDGEIFNANHLKDLARTVCGLDCEMWFTANVNWQDIAKVLGNGGLFILPYDSNPFTKLPALLSGKCAHYGVIVGILVGVSECSENRPCYLKKAHSAEAPRADIQPTQYLYPLHDSMYPRDNISDDSVQLLVQHSLSSKLSIAPFNMFWKSNQQLDAVNEEKFGIQEVDLKGRLLVCHGLAEISQSCVQDTS